MAAELIFSLLKELIDLSTRSVFDTLALRVDPEQVTVWLLDRIAWMVTEPSQKLLLRDFQQYEQITDSYQQLYKLASLGRKDQFLATMTAINDESSRIQHISQLSPLENTFLHIAVSYGHEILAVEIVNLHRPLLFKKNIQGDTGLHIAAKCGRLGMVKSLLRSIPETTQSSITSDGDIENRMSLLGKKNEEGNTALHEALINGHKGVANHLVNTDPSLSFIANNEQKSPLYLATEAGFLLTVKLMINSAADQNNSSSIGKSPLHVAVLRRNKEMLGEITRIGYTINLRDDEGRTPLHYAASIGYFEGVCFFLRKCSSEYHYCNQPDDKDRLPIYSASRKGHVDIVRVLLQHFPASKEKSINLAGQNLLHVAAEYGKHNLVRYFLRNRDRFHMLINHRDNHGNTPLHLATIHKHARVVKYLTWDKGTNLNLSNNDGMTALDIAESTKEVIGSVRGRLTWVALKSAGAKRAKHLHVLLRTTQSLAENVATDGQNASENEEVAAEIIRSCRPNIENLQLQDKKSYTHRVNTLLVMTTLVATVTFAAGFTMPGGYKISDPHEGRATLLTKSMFQVFVIANTIAMYSSVFVAVTLIWAQSGDLIMVFTALRLVMPVLGIALAMLSLAFMAGVYVVLSNLPWLAIVVLVIGTIFLYTLLVLFTPFFFPSTRPTFPHITYYPFYLVAVLASGSQWNDLDED
uniref:ankyrin repeat-containing protein At5g02620-like n=1 Tax=Fragaria vesca subsp. vesca TaxID=101020 RepID=UPI0005C7EF3E|nr:PREDICTED: ankyrin repeat-containing protein At5g02620-like [Fragaria vesca subsp. vesca]